MSPRHGSSPRSARCIIASAADCRAASALAPPAPRVRLAATMAHWAWLGLALTLFAHLPCHRARLLADSTLGLSEIAWAPSFTHPAAAEGPLAGCSATGPVAGSQCLGPSFYLGTPSVARSPTTGALLATADLFDHGPSAECWPNFFVAHREPGWSWERNATIFKSVDNGTTWKFQGWVPKHYWSSLFSHDGALHYMGVSDDKHGGVKLSRSTDDGVSWEGSIIRSDMRYTTGATAVLFTQGRVWRALEGGTDRASMIFSAPVANMLDPQSWRRTKPLPFDAKWIPKSFGPVEQPAQPWVEGNAVEGPDGLIYNLLRLESGWSKSRPIANKAILLRVPAGAFDSATAEGSGDAPALEFVSIIDMPGGSCKFTVRRHAPSGVCVSLPKRLFDSHECHELLGFSLDSIVCSFNA